MAYSDWNHYDSDSTHTLDSNRSTEGNASLNIQGSDSTDVTAGEILAQSESDNPTEGQIITDCYDPGGSDGPSILFRFQGTQNANYYKIRAYHDGPFLQLFAPNGDFLERHDTSTTTGSWVKHKVSYWIDGSNSLRVRWEESTDGGSTYTTIGGSDLVHSTPENTSGGGLGVGIDEITTSNVFYDQTEVYY